MDRKFDSVLLELIRKGRASDALVKVYVKVGMFDEAIDVHFQNSKVRGFVPRIWSCYFFMNLLIECRRVEMVVATYQHLQSINSSPNDYTYTLAIEAFCGRGSSEEAVDVFISHARLCFIWHA
ncbi:hypothetical protein NC653_026475 [Populus alba x Populus x berolinensis]|uniref:Pentatricopeptide repeat-containing protein n=1 Tax=Populus alba x Populus x berolinensis TaxID=444605 RepID=A0AAD6ME61_9ROSI|nr:hypothetical protein NC653_026475 [Populus alba x Populus x berolinensis]